jgi:hypothetical protein
MALPNQAVTGVSDWQFQQSYVERVMDNASYTAAHPDDTLVLAGPARKPTAAPGAAPGQNALLAIGMLQSIQFSQSKPTQPLMAIGSGRSFFVSGKATTQFSIGRLFVNGRNLLRVMHNNAVAGGIDAKLLDDPAALEKKSYYFTNLDSELYYVPFGLGCLFRSKAHDSIGGFYAELCLLNSYGVSVNAGQNMIMESVSGMADRVLPYTAATAADSAGTRTTLDAILNITETGAKNPDGLTEP